MLRVSNVRLREEEAASDTEVDFDLIVEAAAGMCFAKVDLDFEETLSRAEPGLGAAGLVVAGKVIIALPELKGILTN